MLSSVDFLQYSQMPLALYKLAGLFKSFVDGLDISVTIGTLLINIK